MMFRRDRQKGFTLIELLVVVAIVGMLSVALFLLGIAALALPHAGGRWLVLFLLILALFNLTPHHQPLPGDELPAGLGQWQELIGWSQPEFRPEGLCLPPYAACWFSDQ